MAWTPGFLRAFQGLSKVWTPFLRRTLPPSDPSAEPLWRRKTSAIHMFSIIFDCSARSVYAAHALVAHLRTPDLSENRVLMIMHKSQSQVYNDISGNYIYVYMISRSGITVLPPNGMVPPKTWPPAQRPTKIFYTTLYRTYHTIPYYTIVNDTTTTPLPPPQRGWWDTIPYHTIL